MTSILVLNLKMMYIWYQIYKNGYCKLYKILNNVESFLDIHTLNIRVD